MHMLVFVHIEKSAGTSLIHILRRNYFLKYCDVRPLKYGTNGVFTLDDFNQFKKINPRLECLSGHSVKPFGDITTVQDLKLITLLRDPVKRYISQYQHWIEKKTINLPFEDFLKIESVSNFQTKKIAGSDNLDLAKQRLNDFFLVGTLEKFDEFLLLLRNKLMNDNFDPAYNRLNQAKKPGMSDDIIRNFLPQIEERNKSDILLYNYVQDIIREKNRLEYGANLDDDVANFVSSNKVSIQGRLKTNIDFLYRKFYLEPVTKNLRKKNGLQKQGSY